MLYYFDNTVYILANGYYKQVEVVKNGNNYSVKVVKNGKQEIADENKFKPSISTVEAYNKISKNIKRNLELE